MIADKPIPKNFGTYQFKAIPPGGQAGQLSAGKYSMSSLCTVPYVTFVGMEGREKLYSWGELIEIPEGRIATIKNASAHTGDIFLNGGWDYSNAPRRVTVPVPSTSIPLVDGVQIRPEFFVDTRRAIRAWYVVQIIDAGNVNGTTNVIGIFDIHSALSFDPISTAPPFGGGSGFNWGHTLLATESYCMIPLGYCSDIADCVCPMVLADRGMAIINLPGAAVIANATPSFYLLEY